MVNSNSGTSNRSTLLQDSRLKTESLSTSALFPYLPLTPPIASPLCSKYLLPATFAQASLSARYWETSTLINLN